MVVTNLQLLKLWGKDTMRASVAVVGLLAVLSACSMGDRGGDAGQPDYNSAIKGAVPQAYGTPAPAAQGFSPDAAAAAIAAAESGSTGGTPMDPTRQTAAGQPLGVPATSPLDLPPIDSTACAGRGNAFAGIAETTAEMNYVKGGVSDEQDFNAVKGRETIASDKQRIECNKQQYLVVQPGALPERPANEGPNIAAYALSTTNALGQQIYKRPSFYLKNPDKACAKFASPDLAQQAFLAAGGPNRDSKALDPDGDGFACAWDPRPFRTAQP